MTFERWLIVGLVAGFVLDRLIIRAQQYFREESKEERLSCETRERERSYRTGWNDCFLAMDRDERHNYVPKWRADGETGQPTPQEPWEKAPVTRPAQAEETVVNSDTFGA